MKNTFQSYWHSGLRASVFGAMALLLPTTAHAFLDRPIDDPNNFETQFVGGVQWNFGTSHVEAFIGVRRTETYKTDSFGGTKGGQIDLTTPVTLSLDSFDPSLRLLGLVGTREFQTEFGGGVNLFNQNIFESVGIQTICAEGGVNILNKATELDPYLGVDTVCSHRQPGSKGDNPV